VGGEVWAYKPLDMVLSRWAETDPAAARARASQMTGQYGQYAIGIVDSTIARMSGTGPLVPEQALALAQSPTNAASGDNSQNGAARDRAFGVAFRAFVAAGRAAEAAAFIRSLPEPGEQQRLAAELAAQWAYLDLQGAAAWVGQLPGDAALRKGAWDGIKEQWVQQDPAGAVRFALTAFPAGDARTADFRGIATRSLLHGRGHTYDDDVAWNLTQQLPAGPERDAVAAVLSERWSDYASEEAARLVASMTPGKEQTRMAVRVAGGWAAWDPVAAAAWAASFPAGPAREQALPVVAEQWLKTDPPAAQAWLETARSNSTPQEAP
jgi:hypothetical protein